MRGYLEGTEVQERAGNVKKKLTEKEIDRFKVKQKWISRGRYSYMRETGIVLNENQRVFHIDGDRRNDEPDNLVPITFNGTRYDLSHSRVIFNPSAKSFRRN